VTFRHFLLVLPWYFTIVLWYLESCSLATFCGQTLACDQVLHISTFAILQHLNQSMMSDHKHSQTNPSNFTLLFGCRFSFLIFRHPHASTASLRQHCRVCKGNHSTTTKHFWLMKSEKNVNSIRRIIHVHVCFALGPKYILYRP